MCCRPCKFFAYSRGSSQGLQTLSTDLHSRQVQRKLRKVSDIPPGPLKTVVIVKAWKHSLPNSEGSQVHSSHHTFQDFLLLGFLHKNQSLAFFRDIFLPSENTRAVLSAVWKCKLKTLFLFPKIPPCISSIRRLFKSLLSIHPSLPLS